jgi:adenylosuccinate lyase
VQVMREWWGEPHARWIHYGVTSSDLVDTAQGLRFKALVPTLEASGRELINSLNRWVDSRIPVLGRTHGQPAEPTTLGIRATHWEALVSPAILRLLQDTKAMRIAKTSGPVGTYAHNPPDVEMAVAKALGLLPQGIGASQVVPRGNLGRWANSAAEMMQACAKIAMDMRLMDLLDEGWEPQAQGQVGSSSMAHKNNPVRAEQITGLARVGVGYAGMLQPLDLWLERDISHSSVERIAVPDLWHLVLHVIDQTTALLDRFEVHLSSIQDHLMATTGVHTIVKNTNVAIWAGDTVEEAKAWAMGKGGIEATYDPTWFTRNYPRPVGPS